jgi:hypothetical protein
VPFIVSVLQRDQILENVGFGGVQAGAFAVICAAD